MSKKQLLIIYAGHSPTGSTATLAKWIAGNIGGNVNPTHLCPNGQVAMYCKNGKQVCGYPGTDVNQNPLCQTSSLNSSLNDSKIIGGPVGAMKYVNVIIKAASDATADDVDNADGIVLGSGTYNGNPEPDLIDFVDNKLGAGKAEAVLAGKICGTFCTSAGYTTGAQPVLNSLARLAMTFGATFVGGGEWHTSQGVCGMVKDNPDGTWNWDPSMKYLQEDAEAYGERLGLITSFFSESYAKISGNPPATPGQVITCGKCNSNKKNNDKDNGFCWFLIPALLIATILFIILSSKKQNKN